MKKIHIQIQIENQSFELIMKQLKRFVRCTRYFIFVIVTYNFWEIFQIFNIELNLLGESALKIASSIYILWFVIYVCMTLYFFYLSEQYYKVLNYKKKMIYLERFFYIIVATTFLLGCINNFVLDAIALLKLPKSNNDTFLKLQIVTGYVSEILPCIYGLTMIRIVYQINRLDVNEKDDLDETEEIMSNYMESAIDFMD